MVRPADVDTQLESFATNAFRSPQPIIPCHLLDQRYGLCGYLWFGRSPSGPVLPIQLKSLTMPTEERFWLNNEQRLLPGPHHPGQQRQEHPVRFGTGGSFQLSTKYNKRLSEKRVFCHKFGLASGKV